MERNKTGASMRNHLRSGFTLVEIMIVIAVLGILMTIAVPNFQNFMTSRRLNGAARLLMGDMMLAKQRSISLNQRVKVSLINTHEYQMWNDADGNATVADNEGEIIRKDIHPEYRDVTVSRNVDPIFNSRGMAATSATFTVSNPSGSRYIIIALNGRIRISNTP